MAALARSAARRAAAGRRGFPAEAFRASRSRGFVQPPGSAAQEVPTRECSLQAVLSRARFRAAAKKGQAKPRAILSAARFSRIVPPREPTASEIDDEIGFESMRWRRTHQPWERSSMTIPSATELSTEHAESLDAWVEGEIARFVPMQPWPLNMQQVLDMLDPRKLAKFLHSEVLVRIAERIKWLEDIPGYEDIPELVEVHLWHYNTFRDLRLVKRKGSLDAFTKVVQEAVEAGEEIPSKLAFGMQRLHSEKGDAFGHEFADPWLDNFLLNRIGTDFMMAQYLAAAASSGDDDDFMGLIDPHCNVVEICRDVASEVVEICGEETNKRPVVRVEAYSTSGDDQGGVPTFAFIPGYLRVILLEILKNSCRATAEKAKNTAALMKVPITVIICADSQNVHIRINDRAGGIPFEVGEHVWSYFYSTMKKTKGATYGHDASELAGYGVGLPLSRLFAKYLGGSLRLVSLPGYGTSVDITLRRVSAKQVEQVPDDDYEDEAELGRQSLRHLKLRGSAED